MRVNFCWVLGLSFANIFTLNDTVAVSAADGAAVGMCVGNGE